MNVKSLLSIALLSWGMLSYAAILTPEEAISRAQLTTTYQMRLSPSNSFTNPQLVYTIEAADAQPALYVFNRAESALFLSADDSVAPLLGYTDSNAFDPNNIPEGLEYMLQCYAEEIGMVRNGASAPATKADRENIAPLVSTQWNQGSPFNSLCPNGSPSGCVITSLAQVCKYYEYPKSMTGEGTITDNVKGETLTKDLAEFGTFDYANMLDSYTATASEVENQAVANLMSALGYAFGATYKNGVTSASTAKGIRALMNFGYNAATIIRPRVMFTRQEWEDMIYAQLAENHPVPYAGSNSADAGHSFVIDGYEDGLFHVNWGWGGISDGYFLITVLDPANHGIGGNYGSYSMKQIAGLGFYPAPEVSATPDFYIIYDHPFSFSEFNGPKKTDGYEVQIINASHQLHNYSLYPEKFYYEPGLEITDANNPDNTQQVFYTANTRSFSSTGNTYKGVSTLKLNLADGTYIIKPIWHNVTLGGVYPIHCPLGTPQYQKLTIADGYATFSDPEENAKKYPVVDDLAILSGDIALSTRSVSQGTIVNNTDEEFYGQMIGLLVDDEDNLAAESAYNYIQVVNVPAHSEYECQMSSLFSDLDESGEYKFVWAVVDNLDAKKYTIVSNGVKVNVSNEKPETVATVTEVAFNQENIEYLGQTKTFTGVDKHKFSVTFTVTCDEGFFEGYVKLVPIDMESKNSTINSFMTESELFIPMGCSETITFEGDYNCLSQGHTYQLNIFGLNGYDVTPVTSDYYFTVAGEYEEEIIPFVTESIEFKGSGSYNASTMTWENIDAANFDMDLNIYCNALPEDKLYMYLDAYDSNDNSVELYAGFISMTAGKVNTFNIKGDFSSKFTANETYEVYPMIYNYSTSEYLYPEPIFSFTVSDGETPGEKEADYVMESMKFNDNSTYYEEYNLFDGVDAAKFDLSMTIKNNTGADKKKWVSVTVYDYDDDNFSLDLMYEKATLTSAEPTTLNFTGDYSAELTVDHTYYFYVNVYDGDWITVEPYYSFTIADPSGINDAVVNGEVKSEEYYNLQGIRVENPQAGAYIRIIRYTDGKSSIAKVLK